MRIQHNIMAMSAYRNYTNNVSAMKKNLEKLSSGYKINRAGDDAAGLAISEKMRAQITGLETAQKNAKDGISLVQTAEGALTEVHDMLNRMVELATQSSNGTYDNTTDRAALQQELDQLKEEINRISKATNYNGINLLDGSMDGSDIPGELVNVKAGAADAADPALPEIGQILGKDTVLHKGASTATNAQFGFSLHNVTFSNDDATGEIHIKFGDDEIVLTGGATKAELDTGSIISSLTSAAQDSAASGANPRDLAIDGKTYNVEGDTLADQLQSWADQYNEDSTTSGWTASVDSSGNKIKFTATTAGTGSNTTVSGMTGVTGSGGVDGVKQTHTGAFAMTGTPAAGTNFTLNGETYRLFDSSNTTASDGSNAALGDGSFDHEIDINSTTIDSDWFASRLVGKIEVQGFDTGALSGSTVTMTASQNGKNTTTMPTDIISNNFNAGTSGLGVTLTWTAGTTGVDEEYATATSGAVSKLTPELEIGDGKYTVSSTDTKTQLQEFINQYNADKTKDYTASWNDNGDGIKFTAKKAGVTNKTTLGTAGGTTAATGNGATKGTFQIQATGTDGAASPFATDSTMTAKDILAAIMAGSDGNGSVQLNSTDLTVDQINSGVTLSDGATYKISVENDYTLTFTQVDDDTATATLDREVTVSGSDDVINDSELVKGDYQKSTTYNEPNAAAAGNRLASTYFSLTEEMVADGASIFIGGKNYTFTTDANAVKEDSTKVYIGDMVDGKTGKLDVDLTKVAERISVAAKDNEVYTVGYDTNRVTFTERPDYTTGKQEYDLTKLSEIERSLGYTAAPTPSEGKALTLQIGDTADSYNQISVNIAATNTTALGLDDISVAEQDAAQSAVDVIKAAINKVSTIRGTLGATQNRLDHTINNLSVMTENIQDAESTIRDVDVAEEMMAYTKNNILIQSAQAMLAQANQVPQGVLQLLG